MTLGIIAAPSMELLSREPTSAMPERVLFRAYSPRVVSEACVCGGRIEALDLREAIAEAVSVHNASTGHARAMYEMGWR